MIKPDCPALVKVDVEGMEASVLWGARATIARCRPVLYLENQCRNTTADLVATLSGGRGRGGAAGGGTGGGNGVGGNGVGGDGAAAAAAPAAAAADGMGLGSYRCFWDPAPYFAADNYLGLRSPGAVGGGVSLNMICLPSSSQQPQRARGGPAATTEDEEEDDALEKPKETAAAAAIDRRVRVQWMVLRDVVDQLAEASPGAPFVEDYNPVPLRADAGLAAPPYEAALRMADC